MSLETFIAVILAALIAVVLFIVAQKRQGRFEKNLLAKVESIENKLPDPKFYLNGLPQTKNKNKQKILNAALAKMINYEYNSAVNMFQDYLKRFQLDESERCAILNFIGLSQKTIGYSNEALKTFEEMLLIAKRGNDDPALAIAEGNIGIVYYELGDFEKAL